MILHNNKELFSQTLKAASQHLNVLVGFVEKDYWITLILNRLSLSTYADKAVFKGGTSLSKGYRMIDRFSEDVDLAILHTADKTKNEIKTIIRRIEKEITKELIEVKEEGVTSKGSRFRKSLFKYPSSEKNSDNRVIVEINSFANPFPYRLLFIKSFLYDFLDQTNNHHLIEEYQMDTFPVNVLTKEQTLLEKLVSLIRFSFAQDPLHSISSKIRYFYDLYYLVEDVECMQFIESKSFREQFNCLYEHDKELFDEPEGWRDKKLEDSPVITDFDSIWSRVKSQYKNELSALAYRPIPDEKLVSKAFVYLRENIL